MTSGWSAPCAAHETRRWSFVSFARRAASTAPFVSSAMGGVYVRSARLRRDPHPRGVKLGAQLWPQNTSWDAMKEAALHLDKLGWDGIWTWDHYYALSGESERPNFTASEILSGLAAVTQ